ncbi:MAG: PTS sugar transporter subunit IIC [Bacilli bacterium]|nr:PTS sugar transporter subunit IIC [Bacilli bacterium]
MKRLTKEKFKEVWKQFIQYLVKTTNGMAHGLFATLIIGTIIGTIGNFFPVGGFLNTHLLTLNQVLKYATGVGIGMGIAMSLKMDGLKLITVSVAGAIASYVATPVGMKIGDPLAIYFVVIFTSLFINLILKKKTPVDIILVPLVGVIISYTLAVLITGPISYVTTGVGALVYNATELQPLLMGIIISVLMGMALTAPISSAAIAMSINMGPIGFGASVIGCSVQMIGFAVMSRKDNSVGVCVSVGIGTSMLQFKNIIKKPIIWLPTIIVSAILGPIATTILQTQCNNVGAGMGTSGLVGPLQTLATMSYSLEGWLSVGILMILAPVLLVWGLDLLFRKNKWIVAGDLKI